MIQEIVIAVLLIVSLVFLGRTVRSSLRTGRTCGTGCGKCADATERRVLE